MIRDKDKSDSGSTTCNCDGKFVYISKTPSVVYGNDPSGKQTVIKYSNGSTNNSLAMRTVDGRLKSKPAKESDDVITLKEIC